MNVLLGRQAIVNSEKEVIAYELLFRNSDQSPITCDTEATASVVSNLLSMMSIDRVLGAKRGFVNIGIDILRKGLVEILPPNRFVIEILETQKPSQELVLFIQKFKRRGYIFALDDFIINTQQIEYWASILKEIQIVKIDVIDSELEQLKTKIELLKPYKVALLAEKVETYEMFELCKELGFSFYQGYFFTKPDILEAPNLSPSVNGIISVIQTIQTDAEINEIENSFKAHPELILALLKIVNSSSVSPIQEITSVRQAIALLGKKTLLQWLTLLLYSQRRHNNGEKLNLRKDPLFLAASQRGKLMELLINQQKLQKVNKALKDESFLVGVLSLSHVLLNTTLENIVKEFKVSDSIASAILNYQGFLGDLLDFIRSIETNNLSQINHYCTFFKISPDELNDAGHEALKFTMVIASTF